MENQHVSPGVSSVMILTPTRELAVQIMAEVEDHCQGTTGALATDSFHNLFEQNSNGYKWIDING